jgi:hypothetical protein
VPGEGWPTVNNQSSIWLNDLSGSPNNGTNWTRAGASGDTLSQPASPIFGSAIDHEGADIGSPGFAPGSVAIGSPGDYNDSGTVDAADYVVWQKLVGTTSALPNDPDVGTTIDQDQYGTWKENFGEPTAGSGNLTQVPVPEPANLRLIASVLIITLPAHFRRLRRRYLPEHASTNVVHRGD